MGEIYLVRHGQASFGAPDYDQLSELGFEQSRRLGRWFAESGIGLHLAVTGTQRRHTQTAEACLAALGSNVPQITDPDLNEYDHRQMLARHDEKLATPEALRAAIETHPNPRRAFQALFAAAFARWMGSNHEGEYSESFSGFRWRCLEALDRRIAAAARSERIVFFTSGGPITVIVQRALGLADERVAALNFSLANAAVTTLRFRSAEQSLVTLNSFQHLQQAGAERLVNYR
jgi:broad specificity phosphatase PhoE